MRNKHVLVLTIALNLLFNIITYSQNSITTITKDSLIASGRLTVQLKDFAFDASFEIQSYNVSAVINGYNMEVLNIGPKFSTETFKLLNRLKSGQKVYFENIKVKAPDGSIRLIEPYTLKIR